MSRRSNAQIDADELRAAAKVLERYGHPAGTANVLRVIADSIEAGRRTPEAGRAR